MTRYYTGNPVGSADPRDLYDNAENLDDAINGTASRWTDRLGRSRVTVNEAFVALDRTVAAVDSTLKQVEEEASVVLAGIGYLPPVDYAAGINVDSSRVTVSYNNSTYAANADSVPFTTTANFDESKWRLVVGVMGSDLADTAQGSSLVGFADDVAPQYLKTVSDILNGIPINFSSVFKQPASLTKETAADATEKLQSAFDAFRNEGQRGVLELDAGFYGVSSSIRPRSGVSIRGRGMGRSVIYALADGFTTVALDNEVVAGGFYEISDLTVWGYGDRNQSQGSDVNGIFLGRDGAERVSFHRVEVAWARTFAIGGRANFGVAEGCYVHHGFRDGINLTDCRNALILNSDAQYLYDDAFAIHGRATTAEGSSFAKPSMISNCRLLMANGAKILGMENSIINGVSARFARGYAVCAGYDSIEGLISPTGNIISNVTAVDTLNSSLSGQGDAVHALWLISPSRSQGATSQLPALPWNYDSASKRIVTGDQYAGAWGANTPKLGSKALTINNVVLVQTLNDQAKTKFSQFGYGQLWGATGMRDPDFNGSIGTVTGSTQNNNNYRAIRMDGDFDGVTISNSQIVGFSTGIAIRGSRVRNIDISSNQFSRVGLGVDMTPSVTGTTFDSDVIVKECNFDLDPMLEFSDRERDGNGDLTGRWSTTAGVNGYAVRTLRRRGVRIERNTLRNAKSIALTEGLADFTSIEGNSYFAGLDDAGNANGLRGVRTATRPFSNRVVHEDSNPTSSGFRALSGTSAMNREADAMPSSGYYHRGTFVTCSSNATSSGRRVLGWRRETTGASHVSGTDWTTVTNPA